MKITYEVRIPILSGKVNMVIARHDTYADAKKETLSEPKAIIVKVTKEVLYRHNM